MPETINHELICLGAVINLAIDWEIFKGKNPVYVSGLIKFNRTKRRILTHEEQILLLNASSEHFQDIIIGALNTAMRRGEVVNAKITDLNLDQEYIYVAETKTDEPRTIPICESLLSTLLKMKKESDCKFVFTTPNGKPYTSKTVWKTAWGSTLKRSGIPKGIKVIRIVSPEPPVQCRSADTVGPAYQRNILCLLIYRYCP